MSQCRRINCTFDTRNEPKRNQKLLSITTTVEKKRILFEPQASLIA